MYLVFTKAGDAIHDGDNFAETKEMLQVLLDEAVKSGYNVEKDLEIFRRVPAFTYVTAASRLVID